MYKILTHGDPDGVTSAHLFGVAHSGEIESVNFPETFGGGFDESDENMIMTDMRPYKPTFMGTVYDHHLGYDAEGYKEGERKFKLVWKDIPASGIVYETFKDKVPRDEYWKVVVGYVGDGAANKVPSDVWVNNPELLDDVIYIRESWKKDLEGFRLKVYQALSSPINAACKVGKPETALQVLAKAKRPIDIINNGILKSFRTSLKIEMGKILKDARALVLSNQVVYFLYNSEYPGLQGELGAKLEKKFNLTTIVHNVTANAMSIRGVLSDYLVAALNKADYEAGGHHGFAGCTDPSKGDILDVLISATRNLGSAKVETVVVSEEEKPEERGGDKE